jgi:tetratricopeptide (TPR) repeat protein
MHTGDDAGAIRTYSDLFETGWRDTDQLDTYVRLLLKTDQVDRAEADLKRFSDNHADSYRSLSAAILRKQGRQDDAIAMLKAGLETSPIDTSAAEDLIDIYDDLERYTDVLEVCEALVKADHSTPYVLYFRGVAELNLDRLPAAKASFEAALKDSPGDATLKEALEHVNARLGQGDNSVIRTPIDAVPLPESVLADLPDFHPEAPAVYDHQITAVSFEPGQGDAHHRIPQGPRHRPARP